MNPPRRPQLGPHLRRWFPGLGTSTLTSAAAERPAAQRTPRRRAAALGALLAVGFVAGLLPGVAQAHDWQSQGGDAHLRLIDDGYPPQEPLKGPWHAPNHSRPTTVYGRGFAGPGLAEIFQCVAGETGDLRQYCQALGPGATGGLVLDNALLPPVTVGVDGEFTATVQLAPSFTSTAGERSCRGPASDAQCTVVAATFDAATDAVTSRAEHNFCYRDEPVGGNVPQDTNPACVTGAEATTTTTTSTTTTIPPTTTTTVPVPEPCKLREEVVTHQSTDRPPGEPGVYEGESRNTGDAQWEQKRPATSPSARQGHTMAYLPPQGDRPGQTVLFGGLSSQSVDSDECVLGDTWIWDGSAWAQAVGTGGEPVAGPPARYGHAMAYDGTGIVVFGGYDGYGDLADTWTWNGTDWAQATTPEGVAVPGPSARARTAMAYNAADPANLADDHVVLFGGSEIIDGGRHAQVLSDTWTLDTRTKKWTEHTPVVIPPPRAYAHMTYRPGSGPVLHGGWNIHPDGRHDTLSGTFTWDGLTWHTHAGGPSTHSGAMAYRPVTDLVVLQDGYSTSAPSDGVWDGTSWSDPRTGEYFVDREFEVPERLFPAMAEDPLGHLVFFGGLGPLGSVDHAVDTATNPPGLPDTPPPGCETLLRDPPPAMYEHPCYGYLIRTNSYVNGVIGRDWIERADTWALVTPERADPPENFERVKVEVEPFEIVADGKSTATATATVSRAGRPEPGYEITLSTDGDVTFAQSEGETDSQGKFTTTVTASKTPGPERITAEWERPRHYELADQLDITDQSGFPPPRPVSTLLAERGATISVDPLAIPADGHSKSVATASFHAAGVIDEWVCFSTDGEVTFTDPDPRCGPKAGRGKKIGHRTWTVTMAASLTPGIETITATGMVSGLSATTELFVGGGVWFNRSATAAGPVPGRENAAMAYDEDDGIVVLFGGYSSPSTRKPGAYDPNTNTTPLEAAKVLGDTWIWNGRHWIQVGFPPGAAQPSAREGAAMAYDASSGNVLLFGGHDGGVDPRPNDNPRAWWPHDDQGYLADTWSFDAKTKTWTKHDVAGPSKRYMANMASDGAGVVLFSGTAGWAYDPEGQTSLNGPGHLNDTWTWRNGAWTQEHPGTTPPPPTPVEPSRAQFHNDTPIVMPLPPPPPGCPGSNCPPDKANPYPSPIAVQGLEGNVAKVRVSLHGLVHDLNSPADLDIMLVAPDGRAVMLMSDACEAPPPPDWTTNPPPRPEPIDLTFDDSATPLPQKVPCPSGTYRPTDLEEFEATPFHQPDAFPPPAPASAHRTSLGDLRGVDPNGEWQLYVVDDTPNDPNPAGEAGHIYDGEKSWTIDITTTDAPIAPPTPMSSPPGRGRAAIAYHPPTNKVVLYGGTQEHLGYDFVHDIVSTLRRPFIPLGDTWTWDPAAKTWTQEGAGTHPGARRSAAMAYHPGTGQLMLFGGSPGNEGRVGDPSAQPECVIFDWLARNRGWDCSPQTSWLNDTWTWDGRAWARQSPPNGPPGTHMTGMARDSAGRLVMISGFGPTGTTWTWGPRLSVGLSPGVLPADGSSTSVATAKVIDLHGQGIAGLEVSFVTDGDAGVSEVTDHGDGTYTGTVTASHTGGIETLAVFTPLGTSATTLNEVAQDICAPGRATAGPGTWTGEGALADMPTPRYSMAAATGSDGRIYTFGGLWGGRDIVESYNPCNNSWQMLPPMPGGWRGGATAAADHDGRIYVAGGSRPAHWISMDLVELYTPGAGSTPGRWQTLTPLPTPRGGPGAVSRAGNLYVTGGFISTWGGTVGTTAGSYVYSPATAAWSTIAPVERAGHASTLGADGRIFAVGGGGAAIPIGTSNNSAEAYAPDTDSWEDVAPMSTSRGSFGASTGPDGLIYAVGGTPGASESLETAEAYVDCADAWLPVTPMSSRRSGHAVVTGPDGRIYALGGTDKPGVLTDPESADEYAQMNGSVVAYTIDPSTNPCPTASIDDVGVREDPGGLVTARFTVSLDHPAQIPVSVAYQTHDGSATTPGDYLPAAGTVVFAPGETAKPVEVTVVGDTVVEATETFLVELVVPPDQVPDVPEPPVDEAPVDEPDAPPAPETPPLPPAPGTRLGDAEGVGTILDGGPSVSVADARVTEPLVGSAPARFEVSLGSAPRETVVVQYATVDGTAIAGADYTYSSADITFLPGEPTTKVVEVPALADGEAEGDETFTLRLSEPIGAGIVDGDATGTIVDSTPLPTLRVEDPTVVEPATANTPAFFDVILSQTPTSAVAVKFATADGTATTADYSETTGGLEFKPGDALVQRVPVPVHADDVVEGDETFHLSLSDEAGASVVRRQATATIVDTPPVHSYECSAAKNITTTSATLGALTSDRGSNSATFTVVAPNEPTRTFSAQGPDFEASATGLRPGTTYSYTVVFDPGGHAGARPCPLATLDQPPVHTYACASPSVTTTTTATLRGITSDAAVTSATFTVVGADGATTFAAPGPQFSTLATGLDPGTTYTYSVVFDPGGHAGAGTCAFTTEAQPQHTYACAAPSVTDTTATLRATTNDLAVTSAIFTLVGPDGAVGGPLQASRGPSGLFSAPVAGLDADTAYSFGVVFDPGAHDGGSCGFRTDDTSGGPDPFIYECATAVPLGPNSATLTALTDDPTPALTADFTVVDRATGRPVATVSAGRPFSAPVDGLAADTDYRVTVIFDPGSHVASSSCDFTTSTGPPTPVYSCTGASTTQNSATLAAFSDDATVTTANFSVIASDGTLVAILPPAPGTSTFEAMANDLAPGATYTFTVSFDPGGHAQTNAPCGFATDMPDDDSGPPTGGGPPAGPLAVAIPLAVVPPGPPVPVAQPLAQPQTQAQTQAQSQAQSQAQTQAQTQAQAQAQTQAQAQAQTQAQAQAQAQTAGAGAGVAAPQAQGSSQVGASDEREREREVQTVKVSEAGQTYSASAKRPSPVPTGATGAVAGAMALIAGLVFSRRNQSTPAAQRVTLNHRSGRATRRQRRSGR